MTTSDSSNPIPRGAHLSRAIGLFHQGRFDRMEAELREELMQCPEDPETLTWLALALLKLDRSEEALRVAEDAIRLRPDHADAHYVHARILHDQVRRERLLGAIMSRVTGQEATVPTELVEAMEAALAEALRLRPQAVEYLDFRADLRFEQGRYGEALELAEQGLAINAQDVGCLYNRARILARLERNAEAQQAYRAALAVTPENPWLHRGLGELLLREDAAGQALEHLRESLRLRPEQEGELRPLIAEAMKRQSRFYTWFIRHMNSPWLISTIVLVPLGLLFLSFQVHWRVTEVLHRDLIPAVSLLFLLFSAMSAVDPLYNLYLLQTPFGRLMLSENEQHQAWAVGLLILGGLAASIWALAMPDKLTPVYLALFCVFWIDPVVQSFTLYPRSIQRVAAISTVLSVILVLAHLGWRWFGADDEESWKLWYPYAMLLLGSGFFLALVPFILSRSSGEFTFWSPEPRRRAVLVFWGLLLVSWLLLVAGTYGIHFAPDDPTMRSVRRNVLLVGVVFGGVLYFETTIIDGLATRFRRPGERSA